MKRATLTLFLLATTLVIGFGWGVLTERQANRGLPYVKAEEAIVANYVEAVDRDKLIGGCYEGMLRSLGDEYTRYYTEVDLKEQIDREEERKIEDLIQVQYFEVEGRTYAVVWIASFGTQVEREFPKQAALIREQNPAGVILDLRDNLGGRVSAAQAVSGVWIGTDVMARYDNHRGKVELQYGVGEPILRDIPLAVLVNGNSASASEIVAGALRDQLKAPLVGTQTYGKGVVQGFVLLPNGGWAKITTHWWHTPNDVSVSPAGLAPDIEVSAPRCYGCTYMDKAIETAVFEIAK